MIKFEERSRTPHQETIAFRKRERQLDLLVVVRANLLLSDRLSLFATKKRSSSMSRFVEKHSNTRDFIIL